jgi:hypothetical protein
LVQRSASTSFARAERISTSLRGPQLQGDPLGGAVAKTPADVGAADHQVLAVVCPPADEDMDMGIVGIPVVDGDPIELGAEISFGVGHQLAGEGPQVLQLAGILWRHDETKMVPVIRAALGEGPIVGHIGAGIEHPGVGAIVGDAVALEIGDMPGQRRSAEAGPVADNPAHDDDAATG